MSFDGIFYSSGSRGIEEIKGVGDRKLVKGFANYFQNIGGKHEKGSTIGNFQIGHIQVAYSFINWDNCI